MILIAEARAMPVLFPFPEISKKGIKVGRRVIDVKLEFGKLNIFFSVI